MGKAEDGTDPIGDLIENSGYVNGMVTGWTLFVTFIGRDGESRLRSDVMENQVTTTTLGHGQAIVAVESAKLARMFDGEEDDG
jgi:hypothetical protein